MQLTSKNLKIVAAADETHWGGGFSENGLFILLEIEGKGEKTAVSQGEEILDLLLTKITNYKERNIWVLGELINWVKENKAVKSATLGFLHKDALYLANLGIGEVILRRNGKIGQILSSGETSSGKVVAGDTLLFSSKTFLACIDKKKRQELLHRENLTDAAEEAYAQLVGSPNSYGAVALLIKVESQRSTQGEEKSYSTFPKKDYQTIISQRWQSIISRVRQKRQDLWEEGEEARSKKTLLTVAAVLILLLVASIFLNINYSQSANREKLLKQTLDLVSHQYDEAVSLIDLNPGRARLLLSDSKISLSQVLKNFPKNSNEYKQINEWLNKIAEEEVAAYKIFKFTTVPLFFDINLIKSGGIGNKISLHKQIAAILDSKNKTVYSLSLDTKKASIIAGAEVVKNAQTIAVHGQSAYLINDDGIVQIDIPTKTTQTVVKTDKGWGEVGELVAFAGNLYLLDRKNNAIWKYIALEAGFSSRTNYLNPDVNVSFAKVGKMIIDGSVWVLADPSTILKFTSGHGDAFSFKGLSDTISDITTIFTNDEDKSLYVLDKHSQRILVFDKDGNYQSQYQWEELRNADDLVVSEGEKKIFVLSGSKIYAIDIK